MVDTIELTTRFVVPGLVSVTVCAALVEPTACEVNVRDVELNDVPGAKPVPDRVMVWGEPEAVSVMLILPARLPYVVGVNVTLMVQETPAFKLGAQLLV